MKIGLRFYWLCNSCPTQNLFTAIVNLVFTRSQQASSEKKELGPTPHFRQQTTATFTRLACNGDFCVRSSSREHGKLFASVLHLPSNCLIRAQMCVCVLYLLTEAHNVQNKACAIMASFRNASRASDDGGFVAQSGLGFCKVQTICLCMSNANLVGPRIRSVSN